MLNSGKKIRALCDKKKCSNSEKKFLNETKNHNPPPPPCKLNGRSLSSKCSASKFSLNIVSDRFNDKELTNGSFRYKLREKRLRKGPK